jgi:hypothetical protein
VLPDLTLINSTFCPHLRISYDSLNKEILFQPIIFALVSHCVFCEVHCSSSYFRAINLSSSCVGISLLLLNSFTSCASPLVTNFRTSAVYHLFFFRNSFKIVGLSCVVMPCYFILPYSLNPVITPKSAFMLFVIFCKYFLSGEKNWGLGGLILSSFVFKLQKFNLKQYC